MMFGSAAQDASAVLQALGRALAMVEYKPDGTILTANENFCRMVGFTSSELVGKHQRVLVEAKEAKDPDYAALWAKLSRGEPESGAYRRIGKGGKRIWVQASYAPVLDRKARLVKVVETAADITSERVKCAEWSGHSEAISQAQGLAEFSPAGEIVAANTLFLDMTGYTLDEVRGQHHRILVEPSFARLPEYAAFWRRLSAGERISGEFRCLGKGGKPVWVQASYNPIRDMNKVVKIVAFAMDINERVQTVEAIAQSLSAAADNDLQIRLEHPLAPSFEPIRNDFNRTLDQIHTTVLALGASARTIDAGIQQISAASGDLSHRSEQQAASLKKTADALIEITSTAKSSANGAQQASQVATAAKADAARSGAVVGEAVAAMVEINQSSTKITQIIGVIDEIAFQTNLLALNAGVEAARAGDAGRGFAVVAHEVRALAQRSAKAAKEIKALIASSSEQVKRGVTLVDGTGQVLKDIIAKVADMDVLIAGAVKATRAQSAGLTEVNAALKQMELAVQKNAASAETASAVASRLAQEATNMKRRLDVFQTNAPDRPRPVAETQSPVHAQPAKPGPSANPVHRAQAHLATALRSGGAAAMSDAWDEF